MNLEDELRKALQRGEPPAGFASRVVGRAQSAGLQHAPMGFRWATLAACFAAVILLYGGYTVHQRTREEAAGKRAVQALRIASEKLNYTLQQMENQ